MKTFHHEDKKIPFVSRIREADAEKTTKKTARMMSLQSFVVFPSSWLKKHSNLSGCPSGTSDDKGQCPSYFAFPS
jgi:hypothetical protein